MKNNNLPTLNGELYNYELALSADIAQWVEDAGGIAELMEDNDLTDSDELAEYLNDELWVSDSVTGNGSGSYWFSRYNAQLALIGNTASSARLSRSLTQTLQSASATQNPQM